MALEKKRSRKANFTPEELDVLSEEVGRRKKLLFEKFSDTISLESKKKAWTAITLKVNAVSKVERTVEDIRKKWTDWSSAVKSKAAQIKKSMRQTGGGVCDAPGLTSVEERVVQIIGQTAVDGVLGGLESAIQFCDNSNETSADMEEEPVDMFCNEDPELVVGTLDRQLPPPPVAFVPSQQTSPTTPSTSKAVPMKKRRMSSNVSSVEIDLIQIEREKLQIQKERLEIEKEMLGLEKQRAVREDRILYCLERIGSTSSLRSSADDDTVASYRLTDL